jgi:hypothetical protein
MWTTYEMQTDSHRQLMKVKELLSSLKERQDFGPGKGTLRSVGHMGSAAPISNKPDAMDLAPYCRNLPKTTCKIRQKTGAEVLRVSDECRGKLWVDPLPDAFAALQTLRQIVPEIVAPRSSNLH